MRLSCIALLLLFFCTGCWDTKEINQLALVNIAAADKDPKTGIITAYYQVINPTGISAKQSSSKAPVYTFDFKEFSSGKFAEKTGNVMPRLFFTPHLQCYIISETYAKQGILELINFLERDPERRTNVNFLITDSPLSTVLNSFTTLERVPGRYIRSLMDLHARSFHKNVFPSRMKEMAEGIDLHQPTIIPILHYTGAQPASKTDRMEKINASSETMSFTDGAVFIHARMVGRIDPETKKVFYILNKNLKKFVETVEINGAQVDVEAQNVRVRRQYNHSSSHLSVRITADLRIVQNKQENKMTMHNLHEIEAAFNRKLKQKAEAFDQLGKDNDWDLFGLQDEGFNADTWHQAAVSFHVNSKVTTIGNTSTSYN